MSNEQLQYLIDLIEQDIKLMRNELWNIKDELEWDYQYSRIQNKEKLKNVLCGMMEY